MAAKDDIKTFLAGDIPGQLTSPTLGAAVAYSGQEERKNPDAFEVRVKYIRPAPVRRDSGQTRHEFEIFLTMRGWDDSEEDNLVDELETSADELVTAYDGVLALFIAGLGSLQVERVRCYRPDKATITDLRFREIKLIFELDEMEG